MPGRPPKVSDDEIVDAMREAADKYYVVLKTAEVAEFLPIEQNGTLDRLKQLEAEGRVRGRKVSSGWVWWLPENEPN